MKVEKVLHNDDSMSSGIIDCNKCTSPLLKPMCGNSCVAVPDLPDESNITETIEKNIMQVANKNASMLQKQFPDLAKELKHQIPTIDDLIEDLKKNLDLVSLSAEELSREINMLDMLNDVNKGQKMEADFAIIEIKDRMHEVENEYMQTFLNIANDCRLEDK